MTWTRLKMFLPKVLVLITFMSPFAVSTSSGTIQKKRSVNYNAVEGCFSSFPFAGLTKQMGGHNSNLMCQDTCRNKGYILAATKGDECQCGNVYPNGQKVKQSRCTTKCRSWSPCHGPQSCCGGPSAYSVSEVGDIDVAKQVLRRLSHEWETNNGYRRYMKAYVTIPGVQSHIENWWGSFDRVGWSLCRSGTYMTGMYRNTRSGSDPIYLLEEAKCVDAPGYLYPSKKDQDCYNHNWWGSFDRKGWSVCGNGYYMTGLYRTSGHNLYNIEEAKCCRPKSQVKSWGNCYNHNVWSSFDRKGWSSCASGYYMTGLYRSSCQKLYCLEEFKCCKMGAYNGDSWVERPDLAINVKDASGHFKRCSMNAMDKSADSSTYKCADISEHTNMLALNALKFIVEDKNPPNDTKTTRPVKVGHPLLCSAFFIPYRCTKLFTTFSTRSSLKIGTGLSLAVNVGTSVNISGDFSGAGTKPIFRSEIFAATSFNIEASKTKMYNIPDKTEVSVKVPKKKAILINFFRTPLDVKCTWKAVFELVGKHSARWQNGQEVHQDITTALSGPKREMYAIGSWSYQGTDFLTVELTDKFGRKISKGCKHKLGKGKKCYF
ncbi:uncharacterized protein LOC114536743 isoform X2 [Dendronephthya gigantea]|uniref:uncharacterized protein LOC114536743 isoform X2 n=1 Tax=Dendronephthya gigantea TaxID=151771 RepID=UPI00106BFCA3|nr:uncharacterized protein LOC114536743 isoform X2 [Dendronephthya gigantea]